MVGGVVGGVVGGRSRMFVDKIAEIELGRRIKSKPQYLWIAFECMTLLADRGNVDYLCTNCQ